MEWYEASLGGGGSYNGPAYARRLVWLAAVGLMVGLIVAAGSAW